MKPIDLTRPVKFKEPTLEEENLVFRVTNYNEVTNRCYIEVLNLPNWDKGLKPQFLVSKNDIVNID